MIILLQGVITSQLIFGKVHLTFIKDAIIFSFNPMSFTHLFMVESLQMQLFKSMASVGMIINFVTFALCLTYLYAWASKRTIGF